MATTRIMPLHVGKGRTESRAISDIIDYVANPQKTDNGRLIAGFACDSRTVDAEFLLAKRQYTVLENFPLYCPKCKHETLISARQLNISVIKEPDAQTQSR